MKYGVAIIGGGPAGVSAGIYSSRAGLSALIIAKDGGALQKADKVENYYGFPHAIDANELLRRGKEQAERMGAVFLSDEAFGIEELTDEFLIECGSGTRIAKTVILATGKQRNKPKIPGLSEYEGRGVSYCAVCDGAFYRNKRIAVLGSGSYALHETAVLSGYSLEVTILTNGKPLSADAPFKVDTRIISEVLGEKKLMGIRFTDGEEMPADALFVALGTAGTTDFAKRLGIEEANGSIKTNRFGATNVPGLYAAGDCTGGLLQIAKAVGEGAAAGESVVAYLAR